MAGLARGGSVVIAGTFGRTLIQLSGLVLLSRLLTPADFGLVAMVAVFMSVSNMLRDMGLSATALQERELTQQQASNLLWVSLLFSTSIACALFLAAPLISDLYREPRLVQITHVMAFSIVLSGLQAPFRIQLARNRRFVSLAVTDVAGQGLGLLAGILGALAGWGYWALVIQVVTASFALLVLTVLAARWRPSRPRRHIGTRRLLAMSGNYAVAEILSFAAANVDTIMVGVRWGPVQLGYYNRAFQLFALPKSIFTTPLTNVIVPSLNDMKLESDRNLGTLLRLQGTLSLILIAAYLMLASSAPWIIPWLLGENWRPVVPIFIALAVGGWFSAFGPVMFWAFLIAGESRQLLFLHLVTKPLTILLVVLASAHSTLAVAWAYTLALAIGWPISLTWVSKVVGLPFREFFGQGALLVASAAASFVMSLALVAALPDSQVWSPLVAITSSVASFVLLLCLGQTGRRLLRDGLVIIHSLRR